MPELNSSIVRDSFTLHEQAEGTDKIYAINGNKENSDQPVPTSEKVLSIEPAQSPREQVERVLKFLQQICTSDESLQILSSLTEKEYKGIKSRASGELISVLQIIDKFRKEGSISISFAETTKIEKPLAVLSMLDKHVKQKFNEIELPTLLGIPVSDLGDAKNRYTQMYTSLHEFSGGRMVGEATLAKQILSSKIVRYESSVQSRQ